MVNITEEQRELILLIGQPDDGSRQHVVVDGDRVTRELMELGLVCYCGKTTLGVDSYDLTETGEELYDELSSGDAP